MLQYAWFLKQLKGILDTQDLMTLISIKYKNYTIGPLIIQSPF